jgi:hypothetical protein
LVTFAPSNNSQPVISVKTKNIKTSSSIRFRRWSRAGYAMFCSLACAVTIGCVAVSISDKSMQKAIGVSKASSCIDAGEAESPDKLSESMDLEATIQLIQEVTLCENPSDSAAACHQVTYIYFINQNG